MTDAVPGFTLTSFAHEGREHDVYWAGTGPAVIVIHEMPGLHRGVTAFGQRPAPGRDRPGPGRPGLGQGADPRRAVRARAPLQRRQRLASRALRDAPPGTGRGLRGHRDQLLAGKPGRDPGPVALGADARS